MVHFRSLMALLLGVLGTAAAFAQAPAPVGPQTVVRRIYDVGDLVAKPAVFGAAHQDVPAEPAERIVRAVLTALGTPASRAPTIEILNGTRLVVEASPAQQVEVVELLQSFRRMADLAVFVRADLYEVDDAFFKRLARAKRVSIKELERQFLDGVPEKEDSLFKILEKQKPVLAGALHKVDDGATVALLSWQRVVHKGDQAKQTVLVGVAFQAEVRISADRRFVRVKLTERGAEVDEIQKLHTWDPVRKAWADGELPVLREAVHTRVLTIPDGGSILVPVRTRPAPGDAKAQRRWVLSIQPRIYIAEEEKEIRKQALAALLPAVVADVLGNPRLKTARDLYGTPGDTRFALIDSDAWTWPAKPRLAIAGHELVAGKHSGKRLLGIRVDRYREAGEETNPSLTVTLVNAGGNANGAAIGSCTIRYTERSGEKGWAVEQEKGAQP